MRFALPVVLLLFGAASADAQLQTPSPGQPSVPVQSAPAPTPASLAPSRSLPAPAPAFVLPERSTTTPELAARPEAASPGEQAAVPVAQERRRSRLVWFLVGAVVVLGILVAAQ